MALKSADVTAKVIGVYYDVYSEHGHGFLESVYEEAMKIAFDNHSKNIRANPFESVAK